MHSQRCIFRRNRKIVIALLLLFSFIFDAFSQETDEENAITAGIQALDNMETWLLYEQGVYNFEKREYGKALNFFNKLIERHGVYPEAEYWIGRIFEQEGEYVLAERQYLKALEAERVLHIPDEKYRIRYRLADLYKNRGNLDDYTQILNSIILDELNENTLAITNESSIVNTLKRDGIDRMLLLFRHQFSYAIDAFNQMGIYNYKIGNYKIATSRLIFPLLSYFTISIEYIRQNNPQFLYPGSFDELLMNHEDYVFETLEQIIQRKDKDFMFRRNTETLEIIDSEGQFTKAELLLPQTADFYLSGASYCLDLFSKEPVLSELLAEYNLFRTIYYLAASLYAEGYDETSVKLWEIVYNNDKSGRWGLMSFDQLNNPTVESGQTIF